jgi:hypothetical protein
MRSGFLWATGVLRLWMESVWLLLAAGRDIGSVNPFGFSRLLAVSLRSPAPERWIVLDFSWISLVRIETFQLVTRLEAGKLFSQPLSLALAAPGQEPMVEAMRGRRIAHRTSLI